MSITFRLATDTTPDAFSIVCFCDHVFLPGLSWVDATALEFEDWQCPDHPGEQVFVIPDSEVAATTLGHEINMTGARAYTLFRRLGLPWEEAGTISPVELRSLLPLATLDDDGTDTIAITDGGGVLTDAGIRAGYWTRKAEAFGRLIELAIEADTDITWA